MNNIKTENTIRYDEIAEEYNKDWRGSLNKERIKNLKIFEKLIGPPPKKILDVGCGTGRDCVYFASKGYEVYGIDLSQGMLAQADRKAKEKKLKISFSIVDMQALDSSGSSFDGIWTASALVHLNSAEKRKTIKGFYKVLKPSGILYINVQNFLTAKHLMRFFQSYFFYLKHSGNSFFKRVVMFKKRMDWGYAFIDKRHWFYPTKPFLSKLLQREGFSVLKNNNLFSRRINIFAKRDDL